MSGTQTRSVALKPLSGLAAEIYKEASAWQRLISQTSQVELKVYIDLKSPHAYLAIRPSLEVARDYKVQVNFQPFTLSYVDLGLTTAINDDMQRQPPSAAADRKARMYYAAARQYAALQKLPFRTPHRLLDSELGHRALLFAKQQSLDVAFLMNVYLRGWGSGWREYKLESDAHLRQTLLEVGANIAGYDDFVANGGLGAAQLTKIMDAAVASGYVGVPHFVMSDVAANRQLGLFGREHLTLIREKYHAQGLQRHPNVSPEFSHAWRGPDGRV